MDTMMRMVVAEEHVATDKLVAEASTKPHTRQGICPYARVKSQVMVDKRSLLQTLSHIPT